MRLVFYHFFPFNYLGIKKTIGSFCFIYFMLGIEIINTTSRGQIDILKSHNTNLRRVPRYFFYKPQKVITFFQVSPYILIQSFFCILWKHWRLKFVQIVIDSEDLKVNYSYKMYNKKLFPKTRFDDLVKPKKVLTTLELVFFIWRKMKEEVVVKSRR